MKNITKLLAFVVAICLIVGSTSMAWAKENSTNTSTNVQKQSNDNNDIKIYSYTLTVGDTKSITIKSAKYYSVKGKDVIDVTKDGKSLNIEALDEGDASITFKNSKKKVIAKVLFTVEIDELIEETDDSKNVDAVTSATQTVHSTKEVTPTVQPKQSSENNAEPTKVPDKQEEGTNRPLYNGVVYLTVGEKTALTAMNSLADNQSVSLTMADGYIAAVNNGEAISAMITNGTLYVTLKKTADPYVIVADSKGKAIYRIHVLPVK